MDNTIEHGAEGEVSDIGDLGYPEMKMIFKEDFFKKIVQQKKSLVKLDEEVLDLMEKNYAVKNEEEKRKVEYLESVKKSTSEFCATLGSIITLLTEISHKMEGIKTDMVSAKFVVDEDAATDHIITEIDDLVVQQDRIKHCHIMLKRSLNFIKNDLTSTENVIPIDEVFQNLYRSSKSIKKIMLSYEELQEQYLKVIEYYDIMMNPN